MAYRGSRTTARRCGMERWALAILLSLGMAAEGRAQGQPVGQPGAVPPGSVPTGAARVDATRCVVIEVFVREGSPRCVEAKKYLDQLAASRRGLHVVYRDVETNELAHKRLLDIAKFFKVAEPVVPTTYLCKQIVSGFQDAATTGRHIESLLTVEMFVRAGCPKCAQAKADAAVLQSRYPGFSFVFREVVSDAAGRARWEEVSRQHGVVTPGIPTFHACGRVVVGYDGWQATGTQWEQILQGSTFPCPPASAPATAPVTGTAQKRPGAVRGFGRIWSTRPHATPRRAGEKDQPPPPVAGDELPAAPVGAGEPPAPLAGDEPPPPAEGDLTVEGPRQESGGPSASGANEAPSGVTLPVFGRLEWRTVGMPAFTLAIGIVDGFNPCAMWVLLFLLSVLVNLRDRWKILAVAGTFVIVSGLAYFAFMAAWLNVFKIVGYLRPVQYALGVLGVVVGLVHVKDFFAFKKGISFSIPESAKTGIYDRVRKIVSAENVFAAITGAIVLAVLVNIVELLCTAGLPALYTQVLAQQKLEPWQYYGYLALYISAYMFDDSIMVGIVVFTLNRRRLQETEGRWLKFVSGAVMLAMGVVMIVKPEWLV